MHTTQRQIRQFLKVVIPQKVPSAGTSVGDINAGFDVGALDNTSQNDGGVYKDRRVTFSDSGPAVEIYTAGDEIMVFSHRNGFHILLEC